MAQPQQPNHKVARGAEAPMAWFRSERVFMEGSGNWFFQTREGIDVGPYESQFEAEIEAGLLKELLSELTDSTVIRSVIREFVLDSYAMGRPLTPRFREHAQRVEQQAVTA
ncbi:MAG: DUF6316 family protein [Pseudomonadota bacterium]